MPMTASQRAEALMMAEAQGKELRPEHQRELERYRQMGIAKGGKTGSNTTESERTAAFLATRVAGGLNDIRAVTKTDPSSDRPGLGATVAGIFGSEARNLANSPNRRQVEAAQRDILDAALTLGTGAAYTKEQLEGYQESYFPRLTDDEATVEAKRERLRRLIAAARVKAGSAAPQIDQALKMLGPDIGADAGTSAASQGLRPKQMRPREQRDDPLGIR